ncbi:MAG TPA: PAS domain S-box protein [Thermodesulfovibrionia bacterium]|nr:PAS domain S-box protein [Thermodesulfovibrionia bacterium]
MAFLERIIRGKDHLFKETARAVNKKWVFLNKIFHSFTDTTVVATDIDFRIKYFPPQAETIFGCKAEEVIDKTVVEIQKHNSAEVSRFEKAIEKVRKDGEITFVFEQQKDNQVHFYSARIASIKDEDDTLIGYAFFLKDVTESSEVLKSRDKGNDNGKGIHTVKTQQHDADWRLISSGHLVRDVKCLEKSSSDCSKHNRLLQLACLGKLALSYADLSTLMNEVVKVTADALCANYCKILELLPDAEAFLIRACLGWKQELAGDVMISAGIDSQAGYTLLCNQPVIVDDFHTESRFNFSPRIYDDGIVSGISVIIHGRDHPFGVLCAYTSQKQKFTEEDVQFIQAASDILAAAINRTYTDEALKQTHEEQQALLENVNIGFYRDTGDVEGHFLHANSAIARILGYDSVEDLMKVSLSKIFRNPEDRKRLVNEMLQKGYVKERELCLRKKDGTLIWTSCTVKVHYNGQGTIKWIDGVVQDISERKHLEQELIKKLSEKELLLQEIYHRVNNNLQIIHSLFNLQKGYIKSLIKSKDVLNFFRNFQSRIRSIALIHHSLYQSHNLAEINFKPYIEHLAQHLFRLHEIETQRINITIHCDNIPLSINQAVPLGLIINELITNCLLHAFPDNKTGDISIQIKKNSKIDFELIVADNGVGIPEHLITQNQESLGLYMVKILVKQLKGKLKIESQNGTHIQIFFQKIAKK